MKIDPSIGYMIAAARRSPYPCPSGTGEGYIYLTNSPFLNNTIIRICDASFNRGPDMEASLELGLGLGLGIGVPLILVIAWAYIRWARIMCYDGYRGNSGNSIPSPPSPESIKQTVREGLSPELYEMFVKGNLTVQLKKALYMIKEEIGMPLSTYVLHAQNLGHHAMATWINDIKFTTLQDEGIV